jgi:hypothetical protein
MVESSVIVASVGATGITWSPQVVPQLLSHKRTRVTSGDSGNKIRPGESCLHCHKMAEDVSSVRMRTSCVREARRDLGPWPRIPSPDNPLLRTWLARVLGGRCTRWGGRINAPIPDDPVVLPLRRGAVTANQHA